MIYLDYSKNRIKLQRQVAYFIKDRNVILCYNAGMAGINTEIDALKKEMDKTQQDIENLYMKLGQAAGKWHEAIHYKPSYDAYAKLCDIIKEKDSVENQIATLQGAVRKAASNDQEIAKTQLSMNDLEHHFNVLIASLGAVACEVETDGRLPESLYKCLDAFHEYEKKLQKLEAARASHTSGLMSKVSDGKIAKHKETLNDVFYETGKRILDSGELEMVPGQRAQAVIAEMEEIIELKKNYTGKINESKSIISEAHEELKGMGAYGDEAKALKNLEAKDKQISGQLEVAFTEYGRALAMGMDKWLVPEVPKDLRDCCTKVKNASKHLMQQTYHLDYLVFERDIEIHKNQSESLISQAEHLINQRDQIDRQIEEINQHIQQEKTAINELRKKQDVVEREVEGLNL